MLIFVMLVVEIMMFKIETQFLTFMGEIEILVLESEMLTVGKISVFT
jgi:hypothetical protein